MKYLLVLAVVLVGFWYWRNQRRAERSKAAPPKPAEPVLPQDMVRCPVCSVHLPRSDALPGSDGKLYCSAEHLRIARG